MPLRLRLTMWYAVALSLGLGLFALGMWVFVRHHLLGTVDHALQSRVESIGRFLDAEWPVVPDSELPEELVEYAQALPEGNLLQVRDPRGRFLLSSEPLADHAAQVDWTRTADGSRALQTQQGHGQSYRTLVKAVVSHGQPYQVFAATSLETLDGLLHQFSLLLWAAAPLVLLFASACGYWLSGRALAPVEALAAAAQSISIDNLSHRLPVPPVRDELQRLALSWNALLTRLEEAVGHLSQFTADASHELRTPLALIRATAELALRRDRPAAEYRTALSQIHSESESMTRLVEDLLTLARTDAARLPFEQVDLASLVRSACAQVAPLAESKGLRFAPALPDEPLFVRGDEPALRRLVLILLDNAVKYTPVGSVSVSLQQRDGHVTLAVRDTGTGLDESVRPRIFERFYRADQARTPGSGGFGLGLALARWVAQRHGTEIEVESAIGQGSEFRVAFAHWR